MNQRLIRGCAVVAVALCIVFSLLGCHGTTDKLGEDGDQLGRANPAADFAERLIGEWSSMTVAVSVWDTDHVSFRQPTSTAQGGALIELVISERGSMVWEAPDLGPLSWSGDLVIDAVLGDTAEATLTVSGGAPAVSEYAYINRWTYPHTGATCSATLTLSDGDSRLNMELVGIGAGWPDKYNVEIGEGPERTYVLRRDAPSRVSSPVQLFVESVVGAWDLGLVKEPGSLVSAPATPVVMTLSAVGTAQGVLPGTKGELGYVWEEAGTTDTGLIALTLACGRSANILMPGGLPSEWLHPGLTLEGTMSITEDGRSLTLTAGDPRGATVQWFTRR